MIKKVILGIAITATLCSCGDFLSNEAANQAAVDEKLLQEYIATQPVKDYIRLGSTPNYQLKTVVNASAKSINPADELTFYYKISLLNGRGVDSVAESSKNPAVAMFGGNLVLAKIANISDIARALPGFIVSVVSTKEGESTSTILASDWVNGSVAYGPFAANSTARVDVKMIKVRTEDQQLEAYVNSFVSANTTVSQAKTATGLRLIKLNEVAGQTIPAGNSVTVKYKGTYLNGTAFDTGGEFAFIPGAGSVIKGFDEAVMLMRVGEKAKVVLPNAIAYGATPPSGSNIPPYSPLVFDLEIVK